MIRTRWTMSLTLVALLALGTSALAQGPAGRGGRRPGDASGLGGPRGGMRAFGLMARDVDLSDAQRQQVRAIVSKAREDSRPLAERLRQASEARRKAVAARPVDENQIRATTQAVTAAETDLAIARAHVQSDIFALLTPEQQAKVNQARERRQSRLEARRERVEQRRRN